MGFWGFDFDYFGFCEAKLFFRASNFEFCRVILIDMPVIKQAIKKVRQDRRKAQINLKVKTAYKKAVSAFRKGPSTAGLKAVYTALDTAAKTNVIHGNKAARLKSRLSKLIAKPASSKLSPAKSKK